MEYKKMKVEGLEGKELEIANVFNQNIDILIALEAKMAALEGKSDKSVEMQELKSGIADLTTQLAEMKSAQVVVTETAPKNLVELITAEIKSLGVNNMTELKDFLAKNGKREFEIKAISAIASTANTDTVGRTNLDTTVNWTPVRRPAFLGRFRTLAEQSDKSRFGYTEGTYTGAAAYVGEGTGNANSDSASASAQFMTYAKVQAVLSVNTEVYEDIPDFAQGLVNQMQIAAMKFVDDEAYTGDGLAPADVQHIKGLSTYATAAAFGAGGNMLAYAASVKAANVKDLADAIKSYIDNLDGNYVADLCYMNPVDYYKMSKLKDTSNQPLFTYNAMGAPMLGGLEVVTTAKVTANTMLIMDSQVAEWRTKRAMNLKLGQILANDVINDKQSAVLSARYQLLVRNLDQKAIMKVTDVAAAILALTAA